MSASSTLAPRDDPPSLGAGTVCDVALIGRGPRKPPQARGCPVDPWVAQNGQNPFCSAKHVGWDKTEIDGSYEGSLGIVDLESVPVDVMSDA